MIVKFIEKINDDKLLNAIWEILCECDHEFCPPLSCRELPYGDIKNNLDSAQVKPYKYFEEMKKQIFIIAVNEETNVLMGFMAIRHNYSCEELKDYLPTNYLTTLCVKKEFRRCGVASTLYTNFVNNIPEEFKLPFVTTRTWSTNTIHIKYLRDIGFDLVKIIENHRGENIHTYYYAKKTN